ncbi:toxin-antitoxin system YwqK family antitoxin [Wenyingzhuangia sp. IMCC45467]
MKLITIIATFLLVANSSFAQKFETVGIEEEVPAFKKTIKRYFVLKEDHNIKHGAYKEFYKNKIVAEGNYKLNKKESYWVYKSPDEKYIQKGSFIDGKKIGYWVAYSKGIMVSKEFYNDNFRLDSLYYYNLKGTLTRKYYYNQEKKLGVDWRKNYNGFTEESTTLDQDKLHGSLKVFHPNGKLYQEKKYHQGKLYWVSDFYDTDGKIIKVSNFKNGAGILLSYDLDQLNKGKIVEVKSIQYQDSIPNGSFKTLDDKGKMWSTGIMYKTQKVGKWKEWISREKRYKDRDYKSLRGSAKNKKYFEKSTLFDLPPYLSSALSLEYATPMILMENYKESKEMAFHSKEFITKINKFLLKMVDLNELANYVEDCTNRKVIKAKISFKINSLGEADNITVKSENSDIENYYKNIMSKLPVLIPATYCGRLMNLSFNLPVSFGCNRGANRLQMNNYKPRNRGY